MSKMKRKYKSLKKERDVWRSRAKFYLKSLDLYRAMDTIKEIDKGIAALDVLMEQLRKYPNEVANLTKIIKESKERL